MSIDGACALGALMPAFRQLDGRVLVVEDHDRQFKEFSETLVALDVLPLRARGGHDAIRLAAIHHPAVVFIDGLLPGMHGFEVARFIRHMDAEYQPYIVLLTNIYKHVRYRNEAALKYGIDQYELKPILADDVATIFRRALAQQATEVQ